MAHDRARDGVMIVCCKTSQIKQLLRARAAAERVHDDGKIVRLKFDLMKPPYNRPNHRVRYAARLQMMGRPMHNPTPESLAKDFARRWFSHESVAMREIGERELVKLMREAVAQAALPSARREHAA
jgi:hypothetical protein